MAEHPTIPDYAGACISNVVPALLGAPTEMPSWMPSEVPEADQVVLIALDGLGWEQLQERIEVAPTFATMSGGPITTVAPSTTSTALTSLTTGLAPGEHGVVGYRVHVHDEVLNVLRWSAAGSDARNRIPPLEFQPVPPFCGEHPPVVTRAEFATSGFTLAHLEGAEFHGYRLPSTLALEVDKLIRSGSRFVYAYYDGIDKVAHEYGLGEHYLAELRAVDHIVSELVAILPEGACLVVTSDHGQVEVGQNLITLDRTVAAEIESQSGEGRFRWLHARPGRVAALHQAAVELYQDVAWVRTRQEILDEGWFGPKVTNAAARRLGDVALVARDPVSFVDSADSGPFELIGRHGSLTSAEMYVPLLASFGADRGHP